MGISRAESEPGNSGRMAGAPHARRWIGLVLGGALTLGCGSSGTPPSAPPAPPAPPPTATATESTTAAAFPTAAELTIRNISGAAVQYSIGPADADQPMTPHAVGAGELERVPAPGPMDIAYASGGETYSNRLEPGQAYLFRRDEDGLVGLYLGSHGDADVDDLGPFVPTPLDVVDKMLDMAQVQSGDMVFDLGCGDGRIVIQAAKEHGARGVGIDLDPKLIERAKQRAKEAGVQDRVEFRVQDATKADFSSATVVTLYLLPESNALLRPLFDKQLRPGARVVSHDYVVAGWKKRLIGSTSLMASDGKKHFVYLYER